MADTDAFRRRLWQTPLRDLFRGRVTGRLDWRGRLARAALPGEAKDVIGRVVDRTRLWPLEKAAVASELTAHFADGLEAGVPKATLIGDFGDERNAARLIRRARRRGRPLAWQVWRVAGWGLTIAAGLYALILVRFLVTRPTVSIDYIAELNAPLRRVPADQNGWPLYRRALVALGEAKDGRDKTLQAELAARDTDAGRRFLYEATPKDAEWPTLTRWLDAHADGLAVLRQAAAKESMGFVFGPLGSNRDPELAIVEDASPALPLNALLLPMLNHGREFAVLLDADARHAVTQNDGRRVADDIAAMLGIGRQLNDLLAINATVGIGLDERAFTRIEQTLNDRPDLWSEAELAGLAHRVARVGGDTPASLFSLDGERMVFDDLIQRTYSDDGHGDGHLTRPGEATLAMVTGIQGGTGLPEGERQADVVRILATSAASIAISSRRDVLAEYDRMMGLMADYLVRPLRFGTVAGGPMERYLGRLHVINASSLKLTRYLPLAANPPSFQGGARAAEILLGHRDGVVTALALEVYRRQHGQYPTTLDALVPALLPSVPTDRINGRPVLYRLIDGRPVVYSVGADGDDDGGRPAARPARRGDAAETSPDCAALWPVFGDASALPDGDWMLSDGRPPGPPDPRMTATAH